MIRFCSSPRRGPCGSGIRCSGGLPSTKRSGQTPQGYQTPFTCVDRPNWSVPESVHQVVRFALINAFFLLRYRFNSTIQTYTMKHTNKTCKHNTKTGTRNIWHPLNISFYTSKSLSHYLTTLKIKARPSNLWHELCRVLRKCTLCATHVYHVSFLDSGMCFHR